MIEGSAQPTWDDYAPDYEAVHEPLTGQFARAALNFVPVGPEDRVLDIAAGPGTLAVLAAEGGAAVTAIDNSQRMVARLKERLHQNHHARCEAHVMDAAQLRFADASFDAVFCIFGIMVMPDYRAALAEMARVTKHRGRVAVAMWNGLDRMEHVQVWLRAVAAAYPEFRPGLAPENWVVLQDSASLRHLLESAGFGDVTVHTETRRWNVVSPAWFARHGDLSPAAEALYRSLGSASRAAVRTELERQLGARYGHGPFRLAAEAHVAVGRRL